VGGRSLAQVRILKLLVKASERLLKQQQDITKTTEITETIETTKTIEDLKKLELTNTNLHSECNGHVGFERAESVVRHASRTHQGHRCPPSKAPIISVYKHLYMVLTVFISI
jgi:hypothetical protein